MSSLAQEESRSISQNVTWGQRRRFAAGRASVAFSSFLGYEKGEDGKWIVNEEQAETVKLIYRLFLEGNTYSDLSGLEEERDENSAEMNTVSELLRKANDGEGEAAVNAKKKALLETRYLEAKEAYDRCCSEIPHRQARSRRLQLFIKEIGQMDGLMEEFDPRTFGIFVNHMTVHSDWRITVSFKDGTELFS